MPSAGAIEGEIDDGYGNIYVGSVNIWWDCQDPGTYGEPRCWAHSTHASNIPIYGHLYVSWQIEYECETPNLEGPVMTQCSNDTPPRTGCRWAEGDTEGRVSGDKIVHPRVETPSCLYE